ncbi:hypothetical protein D3C85_1531590 [compost metagenome]
MITSYGNTVSGNLLRNVQKKIMCIRSCISMKQTRWIIANSKKPFWIRWEEQPEWYVLIAEKEMCRFRAVPLVMTIGEEQKFNENHPCLSIRIRLQDSTRFCITTTPDQPCITKRNSITIRCRWTREFQIREFLFQIRKIT